MYMYIISKDIKNCCGKRHRKNKLNNQIDLSGFSTPFDWIVEHWGVEHHYFDKNHESNQT